LLRRLPASVPAARARLGMRRFLLFFVIALGALYTTNMVTQILIHFISQLKGAPVINPMEPLLTSGAILPGSDCRKFSGAFSINFDVYAFIIP
jgi:hypothetical protein